jgi:hypothetical protein
MAKPLGGSPEVGIPGGQAVRSERGRKARRAEPKGNKVQMYQATENKPC